MNVIPVPVQQTLEKLKKSLQHNVEIHVIYGGYYVYRASSYYDKERKKPIKTTIYIGRILKNGTFMSFGDFKKCGNLIKRSLECMNYWSCQKIS
ncbi:MAG: hypothetical protein STSR0009_26890 [Methanoregula sp.]